MTYNVFGGTLSLAQSQSHSPITFSPTICPQYLSVNLKCFSVVLVVCLSHYILLYVMFMPLLPSTDGEGIVFYGCTSNHPLTPILRCDTSLLSGGISIKFGTNVHHVSGHCCKGFQGQRSKVRVICTNM